MRYGGIIALAFVAAMSGCGGASKAKSTAGNGAPGPALTIVSSIPAMNARSVAIDAPISVTVSVDLDAASLTTQTVQLMPLVDVMGAAPSPDDPDMQRITGVVSYSAATRTITFVPAGRLLNGIDYHLVLTNLRAVSGSVAGSGELRFHTFENSHIKSVVYDPTTRAVAHTATFEYDANGVIQRGNFYTGAEAPANLTEYDLYANVTLPGGAPVPIDAATYDGKTNQLTGYEADVTANGVVFAHAFFDGAGGDGAWNYADDLVAAYELNEHRHGGHVLFSHYGATGGASQPWSADPTVRAGRFALVHATLRQDDGSGRMLRHISYLSLGDNGVDVDASGNPVPVNDVVMTYHRYEYDGAGRRVRAWQYGSSSLGAPSSGANGADGQWFTADDVPSRLAVTEYDAAGNVTRIVGYDSPGTDGAWESTTDNGVATYAVYSYAANAAILTQRVTYSAGADKRIDTLLGSGDDVKTAEDFYDTSR